MNIDLKKMNVDLTSPIGWGCYTHAISGILNEYNLLHEAFSYIKFYNMCCKDTFPSFDLVGPLDTYISKKNPLYLDCDPNSRHKSDSVSYWWTGLDNVLNKYHYCSLECTSRSEAIKSSKKLISDKRKVIIEIEISKFNSYYEKLGKYTASHDLHYVVLTEWDVVAKQFLVYDPWYTIKFCVSERDVLNALWQDVTEISFFVPENNISKLENSVVNLILQGMRDSLVDGYKIINGEKYYFGRDGIEHFSQNFDCIIETFYSNFREFAPQFMSRATLPYRYLVCSLSTLYQYYLFDIAQNEVFEIFEKIAMRVKSYAEILHSFDLYLDKLAIQKIDIRTKYNTMFNKILIMKDEASRILDDSDKFINFLAE